jgi:glycosyltransferase involved in cell wall biosynthesis
MTSELARHEHPLRVLMLIPYDLETQPFTIRTTMFARVLRRRGHDVEIFYTPWRDRRRGAWKRKVQEVASEDCEVHELPSMLRRAHWRRLSDVVRRADVVHFQKSMPPSSLIAVILAALHHKPLHQDWDDSMAAYCAQQASDAWTSEAALPKRIGKTARALVGWAVLGAAERIIPRISSTVGAASMYLRRKSLDWGCAAEDLFPAPVGVDCERFHSGNRDEELRKTLGLHGPTVLFAGSFDVHPDLVFFARALHVLFQEAPQAQCLIVGGGPGRERLTKLLGDAARAGAIVMTDGLIPLDDMPRYVASCDISALPFRDTSVNRSKSSLTLLESMASALACVTHDVGDIGWMIGDAGIVAPAGDPDAFGKALAALANDPARRQELGQKARRRALERFSWEATVDHLEAAYARALAKRAGTDR